MRSITKGPEPASLTAHRKTAHSDYANYAGKDALRQSLVAEQRGICCYCMGRISDSRMKIEHWRCQERYRQEQLNYGNLLGACMGGEGRSPHEQHCDTRKRNQDLQWNPADPGHRVETRICYELDGSIRSNDVVFNAQLQDVLNLNIQNLKNNRRAVLDALTHWWKYEKARLRGPVPRSEFQRERDKRTGGGGQLEPFCQVAVWWLDQRLAKMSA